ncbi:MAG: bifunctional aspartate kinase/diaminopimelate decarboxylase, partial [Gammaproteobacteria bacterium]|nr:bifunctional aspartate kinase/diaminopimelate decarboxylase [Gammaproteobacteria bacterium]
HDELAAALGVDPAVTAASFADCEQLISGVRLVGEASPRVHARVLATGELAATRLGAAYLSQAGLPVEWIDAREMLRSLPAPDSKERAAVLAARCPFER